ncbi:MAG TPA: acetolactate decarboxylase [Methanospirillum sp.]|nr:acetolactate decarboxylase [Methanospirillum sp.]
MTFFIMVNTKPIRAVLFCIFFLTAYSGVVIADQEHIMYQAGAFSLLEAGKYDQIITVDQMNAEGDFGLGGFEYLDGELIQLNGTVYQVTSDGVVHTPPGDTGITFMNTVIFTPDTSITISNQENRSELEELITHSLPSSDQIYAIRIDGTFQEMKIRSIPGQDEPYPPLSSVVANQSVFNLTNTTGTIIGFWFPAWMQGVNYAGYHLHFLSADQMNGGHILGCTIENGTAMIDNVTALQVIPYV